ncbi:DUF4395 domain-containing protein [Leucobacter zeae]|nr:DUF4395 domain-containing protein [Leucobacter zeae]
MTSTAPQHRDAPPSPTGASVDPRGPRFAASLTAALLFAVVALALLTGSSTDAAALAAADPLRRVAEPAALILLVLFALFVWGAAAGVRRHPFGVLFARVIRPRLAPPAELEPEAPPTFAQGVGAAVTGIGLLLHLAGVPWALPIAVSAAFIAAFLNAAFGFCLGCELYLILRRLGAIRPAR